MSIFFCKDFSQVLAFFVKQRRHIHHQEGIWHIVEFRLQSKISKIQRKILVVGILTI